MILRPTKSTRTYTLVPYTTLFRSPHRHRIAGTIAREELVIARAEIVARRQIENVIWHARQGIGAEIRYDRRAEHPGASPIPLIADAGADHDLALVQRRSEERRGGKACVSTCRSRWSPDH